MVKGLAMRMSSDLWSMVNWLRGYLDDPKFGMAVANGFRIILAHDDLFTKENHVVIRLLYKQWFFNRCFSILKSPLREHHASGINIFYFLFYFIFLFYFCILFVGKQKVY